MKKKSTEDLIIIAELSIDCCLKNDKNGENDKNG